VTLSDTPIEYVLTSPSAWIDNPPEQLVLTESASIGLASGLHVFSEPEAAAIYAFCELKLQSFNVRDGLTLRDARGGAVDLTLSYRIIQSHIFVAAHRPHARIKVQRSNNIP